MQSAKLGAEHASSEMELPATDDVAQLLAHLTGPLKIKAANAQAYAVALAAQDIDAELFDDLALDELESAVSLRLVGPRAAQRATVRRFSVSWASFTWDSTATPRVPRSIY